MGDGGCRGRMLLNKQCGLCRSTWRIPGGRRDRLTGEEGERNEVDTDG